MTRRRKPKRAPSFHVSINGAKYQRLRDRCHAKRIHISHVVDALVNNHIDSQELQ